jgi:hypothetical protein
MNQIVDQALGVEVGAHIHRLQHRLAGATLVPARPGSNMLNEIIQGLVEEDEKVQKIADRACREQRGAKESVPMTEAGELPGPADRCCTIRHDKSAN